MSEENKRELVKLLSEKQVAEIFGVSLASLRSARCRGQIDRRLEVPPFIRVGRKIAYHPDDVAAYIEERRTHPGK